MKKIAVCLASALLCFATIEAANCRIVVGGAFSTAMIGSGYDTVMAAESPTGDAVTVIWTPRQGISHGTSYPPEYGAIHIAASQYRNGEFSGDIEIESTGALLVTYAVLVTDGRVVNVKVPSPGLVCTP